MTEYEFVECSLEKHGSAILEILNEAIVNSTALFDYVPRTEETMTGWFAAKEAGSYPVIGLEDRNGVLVGFGSLGSFRAWPAYKYTVEHSVYVHQDFRGEGIGKTIMHELIKRAENLGFHAMIGGIDAANTASIELHKKLGFRHVGTLPEVGFKFGSWLDLAFYELLLSTPANPADG